MTWVIKEKSSLPDWLTAAVSLLNKETGLAINTIVTARHEPQDRNIWIELICEEENEYIDLMESPHWSALKEALDLAIKLKPALQEWQKHWYYKVTHVPIEFEIHDD